MEHRHPMTFWLHSQLWRSPMSLPQRRLPEPAADSGTRGRESRRSRLRLSEIGQICILQKLKLLDLWRNHRELRSPRHEMINEITLKFSYLGIKTSIWKAQKKTWCESQSLVRRDVANVVCFIGVIGIIGKVDKHEGVGAEADEAPEDYHWIPPLPCEDHGEKCERHPPNHFSNSNQYCAQGCQWLSVGTKPDIALVKIKCSWIQKSVKLA